MRGMRLGPSARVAWLLGMAIALEGRGAWGEGAADALVVEGVQMRIQGRDSEAVERFRKAVELEPDSLRARGQLALALHAVGRWREAEQVMELVLAETPDEWVERHRAELEGSLRTVRAHLAWLQVDAQGPGAVWLDGHRVGSLPLSAPLRVVARRHQLEIRSSDHAPVRKEIDMAPGERVVVDIARPEASPMRPQPDPVPMRRTARWEAQREPRESRARTYGLVLLGAGAAGLATGAAFGTYAIIARRQRDQECDADVCSARGIQIDARGRQAATFSTLLVVTGISSLAGGGVLLWQDQHGRKRAMLEPELGTRVGGARFNVCW
jgi:hypothetical protein